MLLFDIWTKGIDFNLPGNGGPECSNYLSPQRHCLEFAIGVSLSISIGLFGYQLISPVMTNKFDFKQDKRRYIRFATQSLLIGLAITYLLEIGYKLVTYQAVFIVNPCHCFCLIQMAMLFIFLKALDGDNSKVKTLIYLFRTQVFLLHGPTMAIIFPVTNTLFLPGEVLTYWLEHFFLLAIPIFLLKMGVPVPQNSLKDQLGWGFISYGAWGLFHFLFLQPIGILTLANVNSILCPALTDPFAGQNYRTFAIFHQLIITLVCGLLISTFGRREPLSKTV